MFLAAPELVPHLDERQPKGLHQSRVHKHTLRGGREGEMDMNKKREEQVRG